MTRCVFIAYASGEDNLADHIATPIQAAGYTVLHRGTVLVGESIVEEATKALEAGYPVVVCGTERAVGSKSVRRIIQAARARSALVLIVQMEPEADVDTLAFGEVVARYDLDPAQARHDLMTALRKHYPLEDPTGRLQAANDAERRYRELAFEYCDIVDIANLPQDRDMTTRDLRLRGLYIPLRVNIEVEADADADMALFEGVETRREHERRRAAGWSVAQATPGREVRRAPPGERLGPGKRLVVLGDPGAGKTTLTRWIATAYLLRLKQDPAWQDLPDVATLPTADWLPIIVRCRDLDPTALHDNLDAILRHTLRKAEMSDAQADLLVDALREKLDKGQAILLVDGLDEVVNTPSRIRLCQQLEKVVTAYPTAPIIVTSRIVGYTEMGYRIGRGFEHVTVADLTPDEKDEFAQRWCALTEPQRGPTAVTELQQAIHSTDRVERLTSNPMLLTTLALVKRKVSKLPSRRVDLYREAVQVLLNWRPEVGERLDDRETLPQLEYIAYYMCDLGVQRLRDDEILALLTRMRDEYPNVYAIRQHSPDRFLELVEQRTGILVEAGQTAYRGRPRPVYEFRHLTFQEYLAGMALIEGYFPDYDPTRRLASYIGPLAGRIDNTTLQVDEDERDVAVTENWREALRLSLAACNDRDVDASLLAILQPDPIENQAITGRARAALAALCLADEPNASDEVAWTVLETLAKHIGPQDGHNFGQTTLDSAVEEVAKSRWRDLLETCLLNEFQHRDHTTRKNVGMVFGLVVAVALPTDEVARQPWLTELEKRLLSEDANMILAATLALRHELARTFASNWIRPLVPSLVTRLKGLLTYPAPQAMPRPGYSRP